MKNLTVRLEGFNWSIHNGYWVYYVDLLARRGRLVSNNFLAEIDDNIQFKKYLRGLYP